MVRLQGTSGRCPFISKSSAPALPVAFSATSIAASQRDGSRAASTKATPIASKSKAAPTASPLVGTYLNILNLG